MSTSKTLRVMLHMALVLAGCSPAVAPYATATKGPVRLTPSTIAATVSQSWSETRLPAGCRFSSISPNLQWVIYVCEDDLWLAEPTDPSNRTLVQEDFVASTGWAPDGSMFTIGTGLIDQGDYVANLWRVDPGPSLDRILLHGGDFHCDKQLWSPNGKWILVTGGGGKSDEATLIRADGTGLQETISPISLMEWWHAASWSPDGTRLAYASEELFPDVTEVWVLDVETGTATLLYTQNGPATLVPVWSPDGETITVAVESYPGELVILENHTQRIVSRFTLPPEWKPEFDLFWSPNGDRIALNAYAPVQIGIVSLLNGEVSKLSNEDSVNVLGWTQDSGSLVVLERDRVEGEEFVFEETVKRIPVP